MGHIEIAHAVTDALNAQQWDTVATYLADDFRFTGGTAGALDKQGYIALQKAWFAAAPDYHGTLENIRDEGDTGSGTVMLSATQTQPLAMPGLPTIPPTGKHISMTFEMDVKWRGDQLTEMNLKQVGPGVLEQLGVQMPG